MATEVELDSVVWADGPVEGRVTVQCSAHGVLLAARIDLGGEQVRVHFDEPQRRVAAGQSVVFYDDDQVIGGGIAA